MSDYFDLGTYAREITTSSPEAQLWFTRGLVWAYSFNHEEAAWCFERALEADRARPGRLSRRGVPQRPRGEVHQRVGK